jgi:hypothetical protein
MPTSDRTDTIREVLRPIMEHLKELSEGEWLRAQNNAKQLIWERYGPHGPEGMIIELRFSTEAARIASVAAMSDSVTKVDTNTIKTPAEKREDLAARVAAAEAETQRTSGIPFATAPKKGFAAPEIKHFESAETVKPK